MMRNCIPFNKTSCGTFLGFFLSILATLDFGHREPLKKRGQHLVGRQIYGSTGLEKDDIGPQEL